MAEIKTGLRIETRVGRNRRGADMGIDAGCSGLRRTQITLWFDHVLFLREVVRGGDQQDGLKFPERKSYYR